MIENMLIIGGTGSLGKALLRHLVNDYNIAVFSRDEAKHVAIKQMYPQVRSLIGDVRDRDAVFNAVVKSCPDIIINAAALKNVPEVEEVPMEGIRTSLLGTDNLNTSVKLYSMMTNRPIKVLTVSTDKSCKPVNAYGMAKALQERLHVRSNQDGLICNAVRYGNVLESRGSLIPIIKNRFENNLPVYVTHKDMTRFFMTLDASVGLIKTALDDNEGGKIFVPIIRAARIMDVVELLCESYGRDSGSIMMSKIRPGEKINEELVSLEEARRTERAGNVFVIHDVLTDRVFDDIDIEFSSNSPGVLLNRNELRDFLMESGII